MFAGVFHYLKNDNDKYIEIFCTPHFKKKKKKLGTLKLSLFYYNVLKKEKKMIKIHHPESNQRECGVNWGGGEW